MGIASAFYTALSGLSVNSASLSVIGNNLANLNTIGFKGSSTTFQDLFSTNLGASAYQGNGNPSQVGLGATVGAVMQNFGQSTFQSTSNPMDMAIQGQGFFYVSLVNGGFGHSRAGNFTVNQFGFVVDPAGNKLQGYNRNSNGEIDATMGAVDIQLPVGKTVPAFATSEISFTTNLDSTVTTPNHIYTASVNVYDSLGSRHNLLITYVKDLTPGVDNVWNYQIWSPDSDPPTGPQVLPAPQYLAEGVLDFNNGGPGGLTDGTLASITLGAGGTGTPTQEPNGNISFDVAWSNGSSPQPVEWVINTNPNPYTGPGDPASFKLTQVASASGTSDSNQNGYGAGTIKGFTVDQNGFILGTFTNGQTYPCAQVALSIFTNNNGLEKVGENIWKETIASGPANVGTANDLGRGAILGAHYEMSNVDVADEFTRLIITQRGYQANSRIVTTSDEMLQETLALKR
jgi:flagellar hook protein FlgE